MTEQSVEWSDKDSDEEQDQSDETVSSDEGESSFDQELSRSLQYRDWNISKPLIDNMDSIEPITKEHKQRIRSMQYQLTSETYVVRTSYRGYSFHTYRTSDLERKSSDYIKQTSMYTFIQKINVAQPTVSQERLMNIIERVQTTFNDLLSSKSMTYQQYECMHLNRSDVELNYLFFVLHIQKEEKMPTVRPIMNCKRAPTEGISRYVSDRLWSIFDQATHCMTISNGADLVQAFECYSKKGYLQSTTHFVTFNIHEWGIKFQQTVMIEALEWFLSTYATEDHLQGLTIETFVRLIRLVLQNQFFVYRNKLYQQTMGNASGSSLTIPFACIHLFYLRSALLTALVNQNHIELFGRCQDDMFLTWNRSADELRLLFDLPRTTVDEQHQRIRIIPSIGTTFHFLDAELYHDNGILHSKIYHNSMIDQYALPNRFEDGTYHQPSRLLQAILIHAVRCCSDESSFEYERRYIKLVYLLYGFPEDFINDCILRFYKKFHASEVHYLVDRVPYVILRHRVSEYYQELILLKKRWSTEIETIPRLSYCYDSDRLMMISFKRQFMDLFNKYITFLPDFNEPMKDVALAMNTHHVNQKPSHLLLALPQYVKTKKTIVTDEWNDVFLLQKNNNTQNDSIFHSLYSFP